VAAALPWRRLPLAAAALGGGSESINYRHKETFANKKLLKVSKKNMAYLLLHVFDQFYYIYTSLKNRNSMIGFIKLFLIARLV
jgi:hypothetical protein